MFYNLEQEFQEMVVKELGWHIPLDEEKEVREVDANNSEEYFFENFKGKEAEILYIEKMFVLEMFYAINENGLTGYPPQDKFINDVVLAVTSKHEKEATKIATKLMALHENPDKKLLKTMRADHLICAFKTEADLLILAGKLEIVIDISKPLSLLEIATLILSCIQ